MKAGITTILFLGISIVSRAQIMLLDTIPKNYFSKFNLIFLGEYHEAKRVEKTEEKFIQLFKTDRTKVLLEKRYDFNFLYEDFFVKRDTSDFIGYYNKPDRDFARFIYQNRIRVKAIDVLRLNNLVHDPIFNIFDSKRTSLENQRTVDSFIHSGDLYFHGDKKSMKQNSSDLLKKWDSIKTAQKVILGRDSSFVDDYFEALRAALLSADDKTTNTDHASVYREKFMLSMIQKEFVKDIAIESIDN